MGETRKLAAILVADVVGYSRLAGADEDRIFARLRTLGSDLIDPIISVHNGRIVKRTGDGSVIEFRSVVDAVRCAVEVQRRHGRAQRRPAARTSHRVSHWHSSSATSSRKADGDLMGDGVNVAARLEGICEPGGVCLSEDAYRQVKSRLEFQVADLGPQSLKNIAVPVHAYLLAPRRACDAKIARSGDEDAGRPASLACAGGGARARGACGGRLCLARGLRAEFHGRFRGRQAHQRAASFHRCAAVREPERRSTSRNISPTASPTI